MHNKIGTLNEKPLHAALKQWIALPGDSIEVPVDGYTIDIVRGRLMIEIQTASLARIRGKLTKLLNSHSVRLVYPIARDLWIVRLSRNGGKVLGRRKSPRHGTIEFIFEELVSIVQLLAHPDFSLQVVMIQEEQVRRYEGSYSWRRKGWSIRERRLLKVVDQWIFENPQDVQALIPVSLPEFFTTADLAEATGQPVWLAQKMAYCLRIMGTVTVEGKRSRWVLYQRSDTTDM